ncbi:PLP-dependent transferase [Patellaria atrata CBS 101060]|uniref:PLP-dependent transferase n=1 Tax=Patellaria atrata CBS 101060 TaxID=1346257 RepID=A0A9P4VTG8_9PEZI|nr:PLP-dependent transferase [Patellaria atrata CBS 101060]
MVLIKPPADNSPYLPTSHILSIIDEHASTTSLLLLPGIQFYTGQLFDIATITAHAHSRGITVGWDLAHAVGNVPLKLHEWAVDFAVWCNYKYMNSGPGAIGGLFVHEKHGSVGTPPPASESTTPSESERQPSAPPYRPRLSGWWGSDKQSRFAMTNAFVPIPGASGYQLSNPSAVDTTAVLASLSVFASTSIDELRKKSLRLTGYLEYLLLWDHGGSVYEIITPLKEAERGAQLSVKLKEGMLEGVMKVLEEEGVVVDERRPDVVRVAPTPLYNTFEDVWRFVDVFRMACSGVRMGEKEGEGAVMVEAASEDKGWGEVK